MKYRIIRVYENDCDYNYEQLFLVRCSEEQIENLKKLQKEIDNMDYEEREEKYGAGKIEIIENYIMENCGVVETNLVEIDCY